MKKTITIILIAIILILITTSIINGNKKINIENQKIAWEIYDINLENIKNNLDPITTSNENFFWWELKDFNIEDSTYKQSLNRLVANIRMCYLELTDDGTLYTNSNPIRKYRNKNQITPKELEILTKSMKHELGQGCIKSFEAFSANLISNDEERREMLQLKVNKITDHFQNDIFKNENITYNDLLHTKILETSLLEDLSEYIVLEYYRLK